MTQNHKCRGKLAKEKHLRGKETISRQD